MTSSWNAYTSELQILISLAICGQRNLKKMIFVSFTGNWSTLIFVLLADSCNVFGVVGEGRLAIQPDYHMSRPCVNRFVSIYKQTSVGHRPELVGVCLTDRRRFMGLLPDTKNCGLRMRRERFPRPCGLAIPTCITARAWRTVHTGIAN